MDLVPTNLLDKEHVLNNCAYLSPLLAKDPSKSIHIRIKNKIIKTSFIKGVEKNNIAMSKNLREFVGVDMVNPVRVEPYQPKAEE